MSAPAWFDKDVYLVNKLAQLQADEPNNGWDMLKMLEAFNNAGFNPFTDDGIYAHFVAFGNAEGISPNAYFDEGTYFANKLAQLQATEPDKGWTSVDQVKEAFADAGLSAWDHYTLFGAAEGVSPSKYFDTNAYMQAKLAQMQADDPAYTLTQLQQAFKDADLNPIEHYILFGKDENLSYTPYPVPVEDDKPVVELTSATEFTVDGKDTKNVLPTEDYQLVGNAEFLSGAKYEIVAGAKGDVVLKDAVNNIYDNGALTANGKAALALASQVTLADSLQNLLTADLPGDITAKSVSYLVTSSSTSVKLTNATVAEATGIQTALATFLSNPYVTYAEDVTPPASADDVTVTIESITDTVANLSGADLSAFGKATITAEDTAANIDGMTAAVKTDVDTVIVEDKLSNILDMKAYGDVTSFTATDTSATFTLDSGDMMVLGEGAKKVTFNSLQDNATVSLTMGEELTTLDASKFAVTDASGVTFDITGNDEANTITANALGGTIDGGKGADTITLGAGKDIVVIGAGEASDYGTASANASHDNIGTDAGAFATGVDDIEFGGFLTGFKGVSADVTEAANTAGFGATETADHAVFIISGDWEAATGSNGISGVVQSNTNTYGGEALVIGGSGGKTYVWYANDADGDGFGIGDDIKLIAVVSGDGGLTAGDFADLATK